MSESTKKDTRPGVKIAFGKNDVDEYEYFKQEAEDKGIARSKDIRECALQNKKDAFIHRQVLADMGVTLKEGEDYVKDKMVFNTVMRQMEGRFVKTLDRAMRDIDDISERLEVLESMVKIMMYETLGREKFEEVIDKINASS